MCVCVWGGTAAVLKWMVMGGSSAVPEGVGNVCTLSIRIKEGDCEPAGLQVEITRGGVGGAGAGGVGSITWCLQAP